MRCTRVNKQWIFSLCFIIWGGIIAASAQEKTGYDELLIEAERMVFNEPDEAIKIAEHVCEKSSSEEQIIQGHLINSLSYLVKGQYNNAVQATMLAKTHSETNNNINLQVKTGVYSLISLQYLGLNVVASEYLANLKKLPNSDDGEALSYLEAGKWILKGYTSQDASSYNESLSALMEAENILKKQGDNALSHMIRIAQYPLETKPHPNDSIVKKWELMVQSDSVFMYEKMVLNQQLGQLAFMSKNYLNALQYYNTSLEYSKTFDNATFQSWMLNALASVQLALDNAKEFRSNKNTSDQYIAISEAEEEKAINAIYNYINSTHTSRLTKVQQDNKQQLWLLLGLLGILAITYAALKWRYQSRANQYEEFIKFFENRRQVQEPPKKEVPRTSSLPKETEELILHQLKEFEESTLFTNQDMSLAQLASSFETNTKYLSEVINLHKDKNFNAYINDLRINYIIDKLQTNSTYLQYKISYLAEESGFSSHSSFTKVFKSVTGISPIVFIDLLQSQNEPVNPPKKKYESMV